MLTTIVLGNACFDRRFSGTWGGWWSDSTCAISLDGFAAIGGSGMAIGVILTGAAWFASRKGDAADLKGVAMERQLRPSRFCMREHFL